MKLVSCVSSEHHLGPYIVKTREHKIAKRGGDDIVYAKHDQIWHELPRGLAQITLSIGDVSSEEFTVCGLRKFGYAGEYNHSNGEYDVQVYMTKENGEAAKIAAMEYNSERFWVFASKNVHMTVRQACIAEDLEIYSAQRYATAVQVARIFLARISQEAQKHMSDYLCSTGFTLVAECCNLESQHLVAYSKDDLYFFGFACTREYSQQGLTAVPVISGLKLLESWGLKTPCYTVATPENQSVVAREYETTSNCEGAVVYCLVGDKCVYMYKHKNYAYLIRRAVREKLRSGATTNQVMARIGSLNQDMNSTGIDLESLIQRALQFRSYVLTHWNVADVLSHYVDYEFRFSQIDPNEVQRVHEEFLAKEAQRCMLVTVSPCPGVGKSTLMRMLSFLLPKSVWINQDNLGGSKPRYMQALLEASQNMNEVNYVLADKCNHTATMRRDYRSMPIHLVYLHFTHESLEKLEELALQRIASRGEAHMSLTPAKVSNLEKVVSDFIHSYEQPSQSQCLDIPVEMPPCDQVKLVLDYLKIPVESEQIQEAYSKSMQVEKYIMTLKEKPIYYSVDLDLSLLVSWLKEFLPSNLRMREDWHVTLCHMESKTPDLKRMELEKYWESRLGEMCCVRLHSLCWNAKVAAIRVSVHGLTSRVASQNSHPHITLATAKGVSCYYSNLMLADGDYLEIPLGHTLFGKIASH